MLITKEEISIPAEYIAFISIKAGLKFKGLINVSGFHVDPGFKGKLLYSVYNAGTSTVTLRKDNPYFLIWFNKLASSLPTDQLYNDKNNHHQNQNGIPTEYIDAFKRGELTSPNVLNEKIKNLETALRNEILDVKRLKLRNEYLLTLAIGLLIAIGIKLYWDNKAEEFGYQERLKEETLFNELKQDKIHLVTKDEMIKTIDTLIDQKMTTKK